AGVRADPLPAAAFEFCSAGRANGPGPTGTLRPSELLSGATLRYANHTWSNSILPGPLGVFVTGGDTTSTGASSSLKIRSLAAIADCRMLYFSLKSMIGRKKRMAYWVNAISTPRDAAVATRWKEI